MCFKKMSPMLLMLMLTSQSMAEPVKGRYIIYGNALSEKMELVEIEIYSGGRNVILNKPHVITRGLEYGNYMYKRSLDDQRSAARQLVDADKDTAKPGVTLGSKVSTTYLDLNLRNTSIEIDLGEEIAVERMAIYRGRYTQKQFQDIGWRILVVLDANRKIVSSESFNVYGSQWKKNAGRWHFDIKQATGPLAGRYIPQGKTSWLSEAEYIRDCLNKPVEDIVKQMTEQDKNRLERYLQRNTPQQIQLLGEKFFHVVVDINLPSMKQVKTYVEQKNYPKAFEAFKTTIFENLSPLNDLNAGEGTSIYMFYSWEDEKDTLAELRARDLRNKVQVDCNELTVKRFVPGLLPPAKFEFPSQTRPLLLDYAVNNNKESLELWEELTDDWAMGFQEEADKNPENLRDYFVLNVATITRLLKDFYKASITNPDFENEVSGVTLARFLMPILEEIPVSSWRVNRKAVFNHTFNAIPDGLYLGIFLPQFKAIQRLNYENQQGFERLYTYAMYRDGPMIEIGDEGHYLAPVMTPGNLYGIFEHSEFPGWFKPWHKKYFLDNYRINILSGIRNVSQTGAHIRFNANRDAMLYLDHLLDTKNPYWRGNGNRMSWGDYYPILSKPVVSEPQARAVIDTVYGRGAPVFTNQAKKTEQQAIINAYGGSYLGKPDFMSDWLPYAGLWYFRGGWERNDSFLHMVSPSAANSHLSLPGYPLSGTLSNRMFFEVPGSFRFCDYATPLLTTLGTFVDDLPPSPHENRHPSGSKQDTFTQAVEKPQFSRWYTDQSFDFGEAVYEGDYRYYRKEWDRNANQMQLNASDEAVRNAAGTRQIFQVRSSRIFFQVDRLKYAKNNETHINKIYNSLILTEPGTETGKTFSDQEQLRIDSHKNEIYTSSPDNAGLSLSFYGQSQVRIELDTEGMRHPSTRAMMGQSITYNGYRKTTGRDVMTTWQAIGEDVLISAIRAHKPKEQPILFQKDLSTDEFAGAQIKTEGDVVTTLLVARKDKAQLQNDTIRIWGEALLTVKEPGKEVCGLVLGARDLSVNGQKQEIQFNDFQYKLNTLGNLSQINPIRKPIDPPKILPMVNTFVDKTQVTIESQSFDVSIYYTTDGTSPTVKSKRYTGPFTIKENMFVQARAFLHGASSIPFTIDGTQVSAVSYAVFTKQEVMPAIVATSHNYKNGLNYDYLEDRWFALWTYTNDLPAQKSGMVEQLLDVSMRQTDDPFAVRYNGYIKIPETGVYTFYGPHEYVNNVCAPGYDLRLFIDGKEWYLGQIWHGLGMWSVPLEKGMHEFKLTFADARAKDIDNQRVDLWRIKDRGYPDPKTTWRGVTPRIEVAGPGIERQDLPDKWLFRLQD